MNVLTVNTGSSSVKLASFEVDGGAAEPGLHRQYSVRSGLPSHHVASFIEEAGPPDAIAHRVVHGGMELTETRRINGAVSTAIRRLSDLAPLHNPVASRWIETCRDRLPDVPQYAVFDTAFYRDLPEVARYYALPLALQEHYRIRRYGFHGIAHSAMNMRWRELRPDLERGGRLITAQLGSGCSITVTAEGRPRETSMGFSPLEGLVMATRPGDMDAAIVTYLESRAGLDSDELDRLLNHDSGLKGLSRGRADMRELLSAGDRDAERAIAAYCHRLRRYIGGYMAVTGGADGIVFGGGVGEHAPAIRHRALEGMEWAGVRLDHDANEAVTSVEGCITTEDSAVQVWVIPVDEQRVLALEAARRLTGSA